MNTIRFLFILVFISSFSLSAFARIDIKKTKRLYMPVDVSEPLLTAESTQKILPKKVYNGESSASVVQEMLDNTLSLWWEKSPAKNSSVGQVAEKIDKNLKTEVNFGKSPDQKTEHKITVKVLAMQALAQVEYKGWVRAGLNYDAKAAKTEAEVLESLSENKDLVVSQSFTSTENKSQVSLRWNW
jgi:hypothetical protein